MADGTQYGPRGPELFMWPRNNKNHNISKFLKLSFFWDTLYSSRVMALIRSVLRLNPKTQTMASICFSHGDLWSGNLLRKGRSVLAIDFETSTTAPAFVDLGGLLFNWESHFDQKPTYPDQGQRKALALSYLGGSVTKEELEEALFDLEIGFIHRYIFVLLCKHFDVKGDSLEEIELVEKGEKMVRALERGEHVF